MQLRSGFEFGSPDLHKNSDLRSKWNTSTAYILANDSEQVRLLKRGDIVQAYCNTTLGSDVSYKIETATRIS